MILVFPFRFPLNNDTQTKWYHLEKRKHTHTQIGGSLKDTSPTGTWKKVTFEAGTCIRQTHAQLRQKGLDIKGDHLVQPKQEILPKGNPKG